MCTRSSELEIARQDVVGWMSAHFSKDTSWQEIRATVNTLYPELYAKCAKNPTAIAPDGLRKLQKMAKADSASSHLQHI